MKKVFIVLAALSMFLYSNADTADPADPATWQVTANSYQYSMTITTALVFDMEESRDVTDKIAAFVGNDCRGVAQPITYVPQSDRYLAYLLVYSNNVSGDSIKLYMYDKSADRVVEVAQKVAFASNATYGTTEDPYFSITTYDVTIKVMAGTSLISGAKVTLSGYGEKTTNVSGEAVFPNVAPRDSITYTVQSTGYDLLKDSIALKNQDITETAYLTLTRSFYVSDGANPLSNALITLTGYGSKSTGADGRASFSGITPADSIFYTVSLNKYDPFQDSIAAKPSDPGTENVILNLTKYNVNFTIEDDGTKVNNASVLLSGYGTKVTDTNGYVRFNNVIPADSIYYSITTPSYDNYTNSLAVVDKDVNLSIDINLTAYDVSFSIINGQIPVEGARIYLDGYAVKTTNVYGNAVYTNVILADSSAYKIAADGYYQYYDSVAVVTGDVLEKATLSVKTYNAIFNISDGRTPVKSANVAITVANPDRVIDFDASQLPANFTTTGNNTWKTDTTKKFQGVYAIKSGKIFENQFSEITLEDTVVTGNFSFFTKVSSEKNNDKLVFYIDNEEKGRWSGNTDWIHAVYPILAGKHAFKWIYSKDGSNTTGNDCAWVDYIQTPSKEMATLSKSTDNNGRAIFTSLLPYDSIHYTVTDTRYNTYTDSIAVKEQNAEENIDLDINLVFNITKELDRPFTSADSIFLEGYGKKVINSAGICVFQHVTPTDSLQYKIVCPTFDIDSGYMAALVTDTLYSGISLSRYNAQFALSYKSSPISGLNVEIEGLTSLTSDENGEATFDYVLPGSYNYAIDNDSYLRKEGTFTLNQADTVLTLEILPVFNLRFKVHSGSNTGAISIEGASITLSALGRSAVTDGLGEAAFNEITPHDTIYYTVKAEGYRDSTAIATVTNNDVDVDVALFLIPQLSATNFISPNGDGKNDYWEIYNIERYEKFRVDIYASTGEKIYTTTDYENNKWDGKVHGNKIPDGIYYYIVTSPANDIVFKGIINLIN